MITKIQPIINFIKINKKLNFSKASKIEQKMHFLKQKSSFFDRFFDKLDKISLKTNNFLRNVLKTKSLQSLSSKLIKETVAKRLILLNQIYQKKS